MLGLINARGGSKGIPRKNVKPLCGKPLIAYAIEAGLAAKRVNRVVVSTDDQEIADVAREYGADVPFMRPASLASDSALQIEAVKHALTTLKSTGEDFDAVAVLQPTCPLRNAADIDGALQLMDDTEADTVISVTQVQGYHPLTMYVEDGCGSLRPLLDGNPAGVLRQEFSNVWWRNGAVYAIKSSVILEHGTLYGDRIVGYPMPVERSANIDEPLDWDIAELLLRRELEKHSG